MGAKGGHADARISCRRRCGALLTLLITRTTGAALDNLDELVGFAHDLADLIAPIVRADCAADITHVAKDDGSPVTATDRRVEQALRQAIEARYPDHGILGEEFGARDQDRDLVWVLDPIDGTRQFALGLPNFGSLIALCREGTPVIGVIEQPLLGQRCIGVAGRQTEVDGRPVACRRRDRLSDCIMAASGPDSFAKGGIGGLETLRARTAWNVFDGGCLAYASLARGLLDICLDGPNLDPFDICALVPVVEGAGGVITGWHGESLGIHSPGPIIACGSRAAHDQALGCIGPALRP